MRSPDGDELSFFATVATFGTAVEVTTSELSIELTFPADAATAQVLRKLPRR
jgi:MmyB-like transcription regulator ligand binding domain